MASEPGKALSDWDEQAAIVIRRHTELSNLQWNLLREQVNTFSGEVSVMRAEIETLRNTESQFRRAIRTETTEREELRKRLETTIKTIAGSVDDVCGRLQAVADEQHKAQENATKSLAALEVRLADAVHDLRRQQSLVEDIAKLGASFEDERRGRASSQFALEEEIRKIWVAHEQELKLSSVSLNQLECAQKLVETTIASMRNDLGEEVEARKSDIASLTKTVQTEAFERAASDRATLDIIENERQKHSAKDEIAGKYLSCELRTELDKIRCHAQEETRSVLRELGIDDHVAHTERIQHALADLRTDLDIEQRSRQEHDRELDAAIQHVSSSVVQALDREVKERVAGDADASQVTRRIELMMKDQCTTQVMESRFQEFSDALGKEREERELNSSGTQLLLDSCRQELAAEAARRQDDYVALRLGLECLDAQITRQLDDFRKGLEEEAKERVAADEWLEERQGVGNLYSSVSLNLSRPAVPVTAEARMGCCCPSRD